LEPRLERLRGRFVAPQEPFCRARWLCTGPRNGTKIVNMKMPSRFLPRENKISLSSYDGLFFYSLLLMSSHVLLLWPFSSVGHLSTISLDAGGINVD